MRGSQRQREHCPWRETSLMLGLLCRCVAPNLQLADAISQWQALRYRLAEPPRRRKLQREQGREFLS